SFYLGRPWHAGGDASLVPQTTVRNTALSAAVRTTPWTDMAGFTWKSARFAEYKNTGAGSGGASTDRPQLTDAHATQQELARGHAVGARRLARRRPPDRLLTPAGPSPALPAHRSSRCPTAHPGHVVRRPTPSTLSNGPPRAADPGVGRPVPALRRLRGRLRLR